MYKNLEYKNIEGEKWVDIEGFEGLYQVSNLGRVKSVFTKRKDKRGREYKHSPRIIKQSFTTTGYLKVKLSGKDYKVHRLVAQAFLTKPQNKNIINHKDFDPLNNNVNNLEWCTQAYNVLYNIENDRIYKKYHFDKNEVIELYKNGIQAKDIANKLDISVNMVYYIANKNKINRSKFRQKSKYISIDKLKECFNKNITNKEISKLYKVPSTYVARRRYQFNKGEI